MKEEKMMEIQNQYQVNTPHDPNDSLDMGFWFQKVRVSIPVAGVIKIPTQ